MPALLFFKMPNLIKTAVFITGLSGITAQVLILRELLVSFYGNELTLGIILANWIISEGLGVFFMGKIIERVKDKIIWFIILIIVFCLSLPLAIYAARVFKSALGLPMGEGLGLPMIFSVSLGINFIPAFIHGSLFSSASKIYSFGLNNPPSGISKVYAWETLGTAFGGIILTYLFIPNFDYFQIAFTICILNFISCAFLINYCAAKIFRNFILALLIILALGFIFINPSRIHEFSLNKLYKPASVLDYKNSVYGNMVVTQEKKQRTFYYDGIPILTTPQPDFNFIEDFGHLSMLFHPAPKEVLIISQGLGGLSNELLKHPLSNLYYTEIDPLVIEMLRKFPSQIIHRELKDKRLHVINDDGRHFLSNSAKTYDLVLIGIPYPSDLTSNRFFTSQFLRTVKKRLKPEGLLALTLPGSLSYLSPQLRDLNSCVYNAMAREFAYVRLIPGDYNLFLSSQSKGITETSPDLILQRIKERNLKTDILTKTYLDYRLDKEWVKWYQDSAKSSLGKINQDFMPFAVFKMLDYWNKKFSPQFSWVFSFFQSLDLRHMLLAVIFITLIMLGWLKIKRTKREETAIIYAIGTTGFFGMLINLILVFGFQVLYGYIYHRIGLLIGIFMSGIAVGSIMLSCKSKEPKSNLNIFILFEVLIAAFTIFSANILAYLGQGRYPSLSIFIILFFCAGWLMGLEFALASQFCLLGNDRAGEVSGKLYFADLLGGWLAGILGGILFLPVLGIFLSCLLIVFLKISSIFLIISSRIIE